MKTLLTFTFMMLALVLSAIVLSGCAFMEDKPGSLATKWRVECYTAGHGIPVKVPQELAYVHNDGGLNCMAVFP